jgi:hypothetical protein
MDRVPRVIRCFVAALVAAAAGVTPALPSQELFRVVTNYPNPFDSRQETTTICYDLPAEADVAVTIYDLFGNLVRTFAPRREAAGLHTRRWDGTDADGVKVAKGGYLCVVRIESATLQYLVTRKIGVLH